LPMVAPAIESQVARPGRREHRPDAPRSGQARPVFERASLAPWLASPPREEEECSWIPTCHLHCSPRSSTWSRTEGGKASPSEINTTPTSNVQAAARVIIVNGGSSRLHERERFPGHAHDRRSRHARAIALARSLTKAMPSRIEWARTDRPRPLAELDSIVTNGGAARKIRASVASYPRNPLPSRPAVAARRDLRLIQRGIDPRSDA
jgi:hypothetical protein